METDRQAGLAQTSALWSPVAAPYTALQNHLADAERWLNSPTAATSTPLWSGIAAVADSQDQGQISEAVDALLVANVRGWRLGREAGRLRLMLVGGACVEAMELSAVQALGLLVESGGTARVKRCHRGGCQEVFLDWTNAGTRRRCRLHGRNLP